MQAQTTIARHFPTVYEVNCHTKTHLIYSTVYGAELRPMQSPQIPFDVYGAQGGGAPRIWICIITTLPLLYVDEVHRLQGARLLIFRSNYKTGMCWWNMKLYSVNSLPVSRLQSFCKELKLHYKYLNCWILLVPWSPTLHVPSACPPLTPLLACCPMFLWAMAYDLLLHALSSIILPPFVPSVNSSQR